MLAKALKLRMPKPAGVELIVVGWLADALRAPPPETVAEFVTIFGTALEAETLMKTPIWSPGSRDPANVQDSVARVHSRGSLNDEVAPTMLVGVSPAGSVSVTVVGALVPLPPTFVAISSRTLPLLPGAKLVGEEIELIVQPGAL